MGGCNGKLTLCEEGDEREGYPGLEIVSRYKLQAMMTEKDSFEIRKLYRFFYASDRCLSEHEASIVSDQITVSPPRDPSRFVHGYLCPISG